MADITLITKRGDDRTSLLVQLTRGDLTHPDLSGISLANIEFHRKDLTTGVVSSDPASAVIAPATDAIVRYDPTTADVATVKNQVVEVEVTHLDGKIETFPVCDTFKWNIVGDLA